MIGDLKPYPDYKGSGLPWVGDIPGHWVLERAKWLFTKMDRPVRDEDEVITCFRDGMVTLRKNRRLRGFTEATVYSGYQGIRKGDLVIHGMDAFAGAIGVSDSDGKGTPVYSVCQARVDVNASYYAQLVRQMAQSQWILALAKGIRERSTDFRFEMFGNQRVPLPPPDEQAAIVRFLNWANGRLDRAIGLKRKVITLLTEQKRAIIHRAVTRGVDPSIPLKLTGNPWLGEIPKHWGQHALWTLSKLRTVRNPGNMQLLSVFLDRGVIRYEDGGGQVHAPSLDLANYQHVRVGDFVLNNQQAWRGSVGVSGYEGIISPAYIVLSLSDQLDSRFANYLMRSGAMVDQFVAASRGVGDIQRQVFWPYLRMVQVPLPTLDEQKTIVTHLERSTAGLVISISRFEREIELLREYRARIVSDVVTGKLDVREAVAKLPQDAIPAAATDDGTVAVPELIDGEAAA
jgi:type I restriction enzyme S subunit